jgi:hypothetical protein
MPTPIPTLVPVDMPLEPVAVSLPARAVGVITYDEAEVMVLTGEEAMTMVVMVE